MKLLPARKDAEKRLKQLASAICVALVLFSSFVIGLFVLGSPAQVELASHLIKLNMAIGLLFSSISCLFSIPQPLSWWRETLSKLFAFAALTLGAVTLIEYITRSNIGIDEWLARDFRGADTLLYPGRMAPNAAFCLVLLALALLLIDGRAVFNRMAQRLALAAACVGLFALFGYLFEARTFYQFSIYIRITRLAASGVLLLAIALLCARPENGFVKLLLGSRSSGRFARRMFSAAFFFPAVLGWIGMVVESKGYISSATGTGTVAVATVLIFVALVWHSAEAIAESEGDLMASKEIAERASFAKTQFLANMSHEIRTPIGAIIGFTEMLKSETLTPKDRNEFTLIIERNSKNLLRLIDDILDLSKVEAGKIPLVKSDFSLPDLLVDVSSVASLRTAEKGIQFILNLNGQIPELIHTDQLRLRQILTNVIGNAVKFTDVGRVELVVSYFAPKIVFTVRDTGPGISPSESEKIFQTFGQADPSLTRKYGGTGLGLVLSRRLSQLLGGDLMLVESQRDLGSTFEATISPQPVTAAKMVGQRDLKMSAGLAPLTKHEDKLRGLSVLLVEDAPDNRTLIATYLRKTGAVVEMAEDGEQGVEKAMQISPDVILMDVQMPKMDGHAATRKLRELGYVKPIVALTAHAMREERDRCFTSGCDDYLTKPIRRDDLIDVLTRYLQGGSRNSSPARHPAPPSLSH